MVLLKKGAEASLFLEQWHGRKVVMKKRLPKKYRLPQLDESIRSYRTVHEPQLMHQSKEAGVPSPTIFLVDVEEANIVMEFIEGDQVKQILHTLTTEGRRKLCSYIGMLIGNLHKHGIIHGDLTTSNMILTPHGKIVFVDFGLGEFSTELEARGVDLHLMKRAFQSTHYKYAKEGFEAVMEGYSDVTGKKLAEDLLKKIREIEERGRYVSREEG
ncbi:MAG: Kae1-associated serine/threonine protein kinase [Candidatus Bathyarchaeota archaeon]|nr:MAG: Kae1-associated serine/threonine protein kinase [Candidatus Bathyarchaeota archaeon]